MKNKQQISSLLLIMKKKLFLFATAMLFSVLSYAQTTTGVAINSTGADAAASAILDVSSLTKGALVPRMTAVDRIAIVSPATGLLVFQTDAPEGFYYYNAASTWVYLTNTAGVLAIANGGTGSSTQNFVDLTTDQTIAGNKDLSGNTTVGGTLFVTGDSFFVDNTYVGGTLAVWGASFFVDNTSVGGTLGVTGVATLTAAPVLSSATASQALFTDASKNVVSNAITGTGNVVMSVSPTFTGTPTLPTGTIGVTQAAEDSSTAIATTAFVTAAASSSKFVDLTTDQTVAGIKTFSSDVSINGLTVGKGRLSVDDNTAIGVSTLSLNTTGYANTAAGAYSLASNTTGYSNTATGQGTLNSNTEGHNNTANGTGALNYNITGNQNTATGKGALQYNLTGSFNTANGLSALETNESGSSNTAYGVEALVSNTTGNGNTAIGVGSLFSNTSGNSNTAIGANADVLAVDLTNATAIGAGAIGTASNTIQLGNIEVTNVKTSGTITAGDVTYPNTAGTSGDILTTNGTTTASWATPGSFSWGLNGNTGTDPATNFIGTTDDKALVFKVNSQKAGQVSSGTNTSFGYQTLNANTGTYNTANGYMALASNTTGTSNTANGYQALLFNKANSRSTAIGYNAMLYADDRTTLPRNTYNTAVGYEALKGSSIAGDNTGRYNTAIGDGALYSNTMGNSNTANGLYALYYNTAGNSNTANGYMALFLNTTGSENTANGYQALFQNTTGYSNTANGYNALFSNTAGNSNTANGFDAGHNISDGSTANATSSQSVYLGASTKASEIGDNNEIVIGYNATGAGSNTATLGNTSITSTVLRGNVKHYGTTSGYVGLQSPAEPTSYSLTLPTAAPASNGQVLSATMAGVMSWATPSSDWSLNGNTGTNPATNFIGTTDDKALVFKVNSQKAGLVSSGTNTSFGYRTLNAITTGVENTANGFQALFSNTTGSENTANGYQALFQNTTGYSNTANGYNALFFNTIGGYNTANGNQALYSNTVGYYNTANGYKALFSNTTGSNNTANGNQALYSNTTGNSNIAIGDGALYSNTTGYYNTANGLYALYYNTAGNSNTANGYMALFLNTTGVENTANGLYAMASNTTGSSNTANGFHAGKNLTDGSTANATSSQSVYLGASTKASESGDNNEIVIGYDATGAGSNTATLGNTSITSTVLRGNVKHYGTTSGYVGLQSPATVATPYSLTLPTAAPASNGQVLSATMAGVMSWATPTTGTVTSVTGTGPVVSSGGSTPAISIPAATNLINGYATSAQIAAIEANTAKVTNATHTGDAEGDAALIVKKINGVALSGLATGILKNTTTTGVPSIAVAGTDYLSPTSGWSLSGNSGSGSNYIGTTNDQALVFKVNSQKAGEVSSGGNTSFGYQTLNANTGTYNTAIGKSVLYSNTTGQYNTAIGDMALYSNITGYNNTANGAGALKSNTEGYYNTANGVHALYYNTTGSFNTANGVQALFSNTTGTSNTAIGFQALYANTGTSNTANGYRAGNYISDGSTANATSSQSVYLGASTKALANNQSNEIVIGYDATGAGSNTATLGNTSITSTVLRGNVKHYGTSSGYVGLQSPAAPTSYSLTLPTAAPASNGLVLSSTTAGVMSWATPTTGTVTSVTGTGPVVSTGGSTPAISIPAATNSINGYATSAQITAIEANTAKVTNATHTGEVTGSTALTIANDAVTTVKILNANVTYAKIQAVSATSKLLGSSSTTTPVQELSLGSGLSLSGTTLSATGGTVTAMSATGTVAPTSSATYILFSGSTASQIITLPSAVTVGNGREFTIKNVASVSVSIAATAGYLITDNTTLTASTASIGIEPSNNWMKVISDGANWYIIRALY